jgi:ATP phosphoribosyltransferase regulatory subunit
LLEEMGLEGEQREQVKEAIQKKDRSGLEEILERLILTSVQREALLRFPFLFGREEVLDEAGRLSNNPVSRAALENLAQVYTMLKIYKVEDFVNIDLAELRGLDYYTGVVFEGFTRELGYRVCGGGRYDHLLGKYGASFPATGFALDIERAMLALAGRGSWQGEIKGVDFLIIDFQPDKSHALVLARNLRGKGYRVARDIIHRGLEESLAYAKSSNISRAVVLGLAGLASGTALLKDIASGAEEVVEVDRLLK